VKKVFWLVVVGLTLLTPGACRAQAKCPWLNAATAGGVLGGVVEMTVSTPKPNSATPKTEPGVYNQDQNRMDRFDFSCEFKRKAGSSVYSLAIAVTTMNDPAKEYAAFPAQCAGPTVALRAIGNEAVQCVLKPAGSASVEEQVIARVRDRAFVLTIRRPSGVDNPAGGALSDTARNVAEQVAGSIF